MCRVQGGGLQGGRVRLVLLLIVCLEVGGALVLVDEVGIAG